MPGIVGWLGSAKEPVSFQKAVADLCARPYDRVVDVDGVREGKLAIVHPDINPIGYGHMYDAASGRTVAFWGEFYGPEFEACASGSDTCGVLLAQLGDDPLERLERLDGSFILFLQTPHRRILAADRLASRPLYYSATASGIVFSPELKSFAHLAAGRPALNRNAFVSFVVNGHALADETYYRGVFLLRPGAFLELRNGKLAAGIYADYIPASTSATDRGETVYREELAALLRAAVWKRRGNLAQAVFPISGGYDSRGILACVREFHSGRLATVSWGTDENDPLADAAVGRNVAQYFGTEHQFLRRDAGYLAEGLAHGVHDNDAGNADSFIHPHEPVLISGLRDAGHPLLFRGDECFGYSGPAMSRMEALARVGVCELAQYPGMHALFRDGALRPALEEQSQTIHRLMEWCPEFGDWSIVKDWMYLQQRMFRSLNFSHYNKLAILEARNPWFDRDVLAFYGRLPVSHRYDKALYRSTLHCMFPDLMRKIPIATRHSLEDWAARLRGDSWFLQFARKNLVEDRSPIHEFWRPDALAATIEAFARGNSRESLRVRAVEAAKPFVRQYLKPLYRSLKRSVLSPVAVRAMPAEALIGRCLVLKLWCDRWA
jgi:hypothetical protein